MASKKKNNAVDLPSQADPRAPLDGALLLAKAQGLLTELEADLLARARGSVPVREGLRLRHEAERVARRTADPSEVWERHFVTQVAASWLLSCVFVRTLEDRGLFGHNRIAGPGATDSQRLFFELAPSLTEREYLLTIFRELSRLPAARDLFDARHNPVWMLGPSAEMAKKLLALFRTPNAEAPGLRFGQADTRFLGDLYQDLSADVRERFALLQTPHFVEKYILDRTLERAIARFGLDETTLIDPTCGSGHFLLGAFERLVEHRLRKEPGLDVREAARRALDAIYGADINPYAVAIARFRLTLAFLEKAGHARLAEAPTMPQHLVVGDSLLHAPQQGNLGDVAGTSKASWAGSQFALEDEVVAKQVLFRRYAVVVGNPPYITVKDAVLRERYREMYPRSASGKYSVAAPFTERFFLLARSAGFVGMITANSFMKREFGKRLIEECLASIDVTLVIDTSTAHIPGHGTPTVMIFGQHQPPQAADVVMVLAKRAEIPLPEANPERGLVWTAIAERSDTVGYENDYVSVVAVARSTLGRHPWSLGSGGTGALKEWLEGHADKTLSEVVDDIGPASFPGLDEAFIMPGAAAKRMGMTDALVRPMVVGEDVRDWAVTPIQCALTPYDRHAQQLLPYDGTKPWGRFLWRYRTSLQGVISFGGKTRKDSGEPWWSWYRWIPNRYLSPLRICFAFIATHNHFVIDRGDRVFKQSAPVLSVSGGTEEHYQALLAYLNSSTACFWMKQVCFQKSAANARGDARELPERISFEFSSTPLLKMPLPALPSSLTDLTRTMETLLVARETGSPNNVVRDAVSLGEGPLRARLSAASLVDEGRFAAMKELQARIDEAVYDAFSLSPDQRDLIEQALYKRPWRGTQGVFHKGEWTFMERAAETLQAVVAEDLERTVRLQPFPISRRQLVRAALQSAASAAAAALLLSERATDNGGPDAVIGRVLADEAVPYLPCARFTQSGLEKYADWVRIWELQRAEDRGDGVSHAQPPPKFEPNNYVNSRYWQLRGKLDVPKERFISYPGCESDEDEEPVYGWAGWNHVQQAQALAALYQKRKTEESWGKERLTPMLAGLLELIPWVKQWHNEPSAEFGGLRLGDYFETFLDAECHALGLTREDLRAWRPAEKSKARKAAEKKAKAGAAEAESYGDPAPKPRGRKKKTVTEVTET